MEGESPLLKDGALSLQTSLTHRELSPSAPALTWRRFDSLCLGRVHFGKVFVFGEVRFFAECGFALFLWGVREAL